MTLSYAVAQRPAGGETVCGDIARIVVGASTIIALADGLGHGPPARVAAEAFTSFVADHLDEPLESLMGTASKALADTRGAAAAILRIGPDLVAEYAAVGNIDLQTVSRDAFRPFGTAGIVGRPLRRTPLFRHRFWTGDLIALYSDGISSRFSLATYAELEVQQAADRIVALHGKCHDDATCVVLRC